jgi:hypothetical protein
MTSKLFITAALVVAGTLGLNAQVVYFNGLGRALVTTENLKGNMLSQVDSSFSSVKSKDTLSNRKSTDGYTLFDLGINAQPSEVLRASAILRIRNEFGGFYGDGSNLVFRQIRLDGIIAKKVKYEIGDIDMELTPYTLYNFNESYHEYEADVFAIRRGIVHYENFNFGNKWRMQGANATANFRFTKVIEKLGVRAFGTRTNSAVFKNQSSPDRLIAGGRLDVVQSQYFQLGATYVGLTDMPQTAGSSSYIYKNDVLTFDAKATFGTEKIDFILSGEGGYSNNSYLRINEDSAKGKDYFYDAGFAVRYKPLNLKAYVNYRDVGYDFSSPSAQTRRIYDYGLATQYFPQIFNNSQLRASFIDNGELMAGTTLLDRMVDENNRNLNIQTSLMNYMPQYNNVTPYGQATPNRKGFTFGVSGGETDRTLKGEFAYDMLSEIVGEGTPDNETRSYSAFRGGLLFNANRPLRWEKSIALKLGIRNENTSREGVNKIDFKSNMIDAGLTAEFVKQLDLLLGYKMLTASGNEVVAIRNAVNEITTYQLYNVKDNQSLISYGLRYRFSKNTFFSAQGVHATNTYRKTSLNYSINQLFLNYTMIF